MFAMLHQLKFRIIIPKLTTLVLNIFSRQDKKKKKKKKKKNWFRKQQPSANTKKEISPYKRKT